MKLMDQYLNVRHIASLEWRLAIVIVIVGFTAVMSETATGAVGLYVFLAFLIGLFVSRVWNGRSSRGGEPPKLEALRKAIESAPNGLCIFDADLRVVISNSHFAEMYGLDPVQTRPGTSLSEIVQSRIASSYCPLDAPMYALDCVKSARSSEPLSTVDELRNGRIFSIIRHRMADGGLVEVHKDITDTRLAETRAESAREELINKQYAIDQAVIVAVTDVYGTITYANDNFCKISGYSREELLGKNHRIINSGVHSRAFFREMYECLARGEVWRGELCNKSKSGALYWVDTVITPQLGPDGKPISYMAIRIDITARKRAEAQIAHAATHDALTGLANRTALLDRMNDVLGRMQEHATPLTVYLLDLDGFKHVNDTLGHTAGDNLLKELARRLNSLLGENDMVGRLGGDEFAIVQTEFVDQREDAIKLAGKLMEMAAQPFDVEGHQACIGASVGIALAPANGVTASELLKKADLALYRVKSEGRNNFSFFEEELSERAITRLQLINDMRAALTRGEFELHYQPFFDAKTSRLCGMEALIRWRHPVEGLLYPDRFIGIAEEAGLMEPLGQWVLQKACADAVSWSEHIKVAVNLSAAQFRSGSLFDVILCVLVETGLPPQRLELEITESLLLQDRESNVLVVRQLKNIGTTITLDDFGTGYASLAYLLSFPFDKIKIDKSFIRDLSTRPACKAVVASILTLARGLDITVTAEGVETRDQLELLRDQGVPYVQGYLFGWPRALTTIDLAALDPAARSDVAA